ncbi:M6 family metalloprotease domain-containing protein [candidate division KSB1 bacterium]|nr:M6 family metalloprotease domain-containing protein [candidate division KSB1 bacterium]NIR69994.1 M6 family metalloprotease domain-containing protein [candidate division KSB1 bacterium]NIS23017.1 M6 family metalloprotease domain-containing protein [candidate division KSB1 bacterium]NIT69875.1 M6 family metalloprotease domain-containing protein [candidate division KSB1 bacterium]NIU23524.1 M6 family metalloprotease domain-containing protein [candidate division KSB1 bacterium]
MDAKTRQVLAKGESFIREASEPSRFVQKGEARGTWQALIILIDFPDYRWNHRDDLNFFNEDTLYVPAHYEQMLFSLKTFKHPYSQHGYTGSMRDFYLENSYGRFEVTGVVTRWYTASNPRSFYANGKAGFGAYPNSSRKLVEEAVLLADDDVDYSQFDNNADGRVDALFVVHAGPGAEEIYTENFPEHDNYLWSHKASIQTRVLDDVAVSEYTLEPENGSIGVFCHEFGHALGLPDLYDTDGSSEGIGEWGLMGGGGWCHREGDPLGTSPAHFTAWSKSRLGWLEPTTVNANLMQVDIPPVELQPVAFRLWTDGQIGREYFLIENRQNIGFDVGLTRRQKDFGLADAHGLIVYHVDYFGRQNDERRRFIDVEEASPYDSLGQPIEQLDLKRVLPKHEFLSNGNRGDNGDPFPGFSQLNQLGTDFLGNRDLTEFNASTSPNSNDNDGNPTPVAMANIKEIGVKIMADLFVSPVTSADHQPVAVVSETPGQFVLGQNFPNPFNPDTQIEFSILGNYRTPIILGIYNLKGKLVRTLVNEKMSPGTHTALWDGTDKFGQKVASGIYIYKLICQSQSQTRQMILLR